IDIPQGCHTFSGDEALAYARSRHLKWMDEGGKTHEDGTSDLGRISRQQDFLRRTLQAALDKGVFDPAVARALIESLQTDIVTEAGFTVNDMLQYAGALEGIAPSAIGMYQVEATGVMVSGNSVLQPELASDRMQAVLAIFRGEDALLPAAASAAEEATGDTRVELTTLPPEAVGDILPDPSVSCS
ncbi:MAG: LCP family protein, partial [Ilumatobacteraceae bacterium]